MKNFIFEKKMYELLQHQNVIDWINNIVFLQQFKSLESFKIISRLILFFYKL